MTKAKIVAKVAEEIKISKTAAGKALALITDSIAQSMRKGQKVTLVGFGTFSVVQRKTRKGRNPRTGEEIKIAAKKAPKFTAGSALKAAAEGKAPAKWASSKKAPAKKEKEVGQTGRAAKRSALPPLQVIVQLSPSCVPFKTDVVVSVPVIADVPTITTRSIERGDAENPKT